MPTRSTEAGRLRRGRATSEVCPVDCDGPWIVVKVGCPTGRASLRALRSDRVVRAGQDAMPSTARTCRCDRVTSAGRTSTMRSASTLSPSALTGRPSGSVQVSMCNGSALVLSNSASPISGASGERAVMFVLTSRESSNCWVRGYPVVRLDDATGPIPFHYVDGHTQYVTSRPPEAVVLSPHDAGWVLIAKYRCDVGSMRRAIRVTLTLSQPKVALTLALPHHYGIQSLDYCVGGANDLGQTVATSPITASSDDTAS